LSVEVSGPLFFERADLHSVCLITMRWMALNLAKLGRTVVWSALATALITPFCRAESPNVARAFGHAVADAVDKAMPAVVVVRTEAVVYHQARAFPLGPVYGIPERLAGQGSGVIISRDGHVLTSHHVIRNAGQIQVALHDGTLYPATLVGSDPLTDLAVLQIEAPGEAGFTPIEVADSDAVRIGEFAIAIGSPFSLNSSVTLGVVSQKGRSVGVLPYEDFIQTDAPINPGNSGGPLVDVDGRMVGINAVIQTGGPYARGNIGIGFAVPANLAMRIADSLIRTGRAERPWLGIRLRDIINTPGSVAGPSGVQVGEVLGNTPAAVGGLKAGDFILSVDNVQVNDSRGVQRAVFKRNLGDPVRLRVMREGREIEFEIVTEAMPDLGRLEK